LPRFSGSKVRVRSLPHPRYHCRYAEISLVGSGDTILDGYVDTTGWHGTQVTESFEHPEWRKRKAFAIGDIGGPFFSQRTGVSAIGGDVILDDKPRIKGASSTTTYVGKMLPVAANRMSYPVGNVSSISTLNALGATAIARCKPTNATADLSTFLGELFREGLPRLIGASSGLWKERTKSARKASADEYLNAQFGWAPIARDMSSIAYAIYSADKVLRQYERDSGKMVRRRYVFPPVNSLSFSEVDAGVTPWILGGVSGNLLDPTSTARGTVYREDQTYRRQWFSGGFTYHLPDSYSRNSEMARIALEAKKLLGLSLTPDVVWNLTPWSWAVDWFSNVGDVLSNITDALTDSLVMGYGYMMENTVQRRTYTYAGPTGAKTRGARPAVVRFEVNSKQRVQANPYGFGLTWNSLSPFQLSILAALGITKHGK